MIVKLLTEHHFEFLSLTGGCTGSSESTNVKMPHCWKSHALAQISVGFAPADNVEAVLINIFWFCNYSFIRCIIFTQKGR